MLVALPMAFSAQLVHAQAGTLDMTFNVSDDGTYGDGASHWVGAIELQPDGGILIGGRFTVYNGMVRWRLARLHPDGSLDATFNAGVINDDVNAVVARPDGKVLVAGNFTQFNGALVGGIARTNGDGSIDTTFNTCSGVGGSGFPSVQTMRVQSDGKILVAGVFSTACGVARNSIARLNVDGGIDTTFAPVSGPGSSLGSPLVRAMEIQGDGKILIWGTFNEYDGIARQGFARLLPDGTLDVAYAPVVGAAITGGVLQPDGKCIIFGDFATVNGVSIERIARLEPDGTLDATFQPGGGPQYGTAGALVYPDGRILLHGAFTSYDYTPRHGLARLLPDGSLDGSFDPGTGVNLYGYIMAIALQPDGGIVAGGYFTSYDGMSAGRVLRILPVGGRDASFDPGPGADAEVHAIVQQPDGKILIGGSFIRYDASIQNRIARLNLDGTIDAGFNTGAGASGSIWDIALQPDGKILIAGDFNFYDGVFRNRLARLHADGSLDWSFDPGTGANDDIYTISLQSSGKIFVGGAFTTMNDEPRKGIAQLEADGSLDALFTPTSGVTGTTWGPYWDEVYYVRDSHAQSDGKIVIGGYFSSVNGTSRTNFARLNANGTTDMSFGTSNGAGGKVYSISVQPDGKILLVGGFTSLGTTSRHRIARANSNGTCDVTFDPGSGANAELLDVAIEGDGRIVVIGRATQFNGVPVGRIFRVETDGTFDGTFATTTGFEALLSTGYDPVATIAVQADEGILVGGTFINGNGQARHRIARLNNDFSTAIAMPDRPMAGTIHPNPTSGIFTVSSVLGPYDLRVFDPIGRPILERQSSHSLHARLTIDLTDRPAGIYILQWTTPSATFTERVVKE